MFNPLNLLQVSIISMGVASSTPICNDYKEPNNRNPLTEKNSTTTANYNLLITQNYIGYVNASNQYVNDMNGSVYDEGNVLDSKTNLALTSNYLNIVGNKYYTQAYNTAQATGNDYNITEFRSDSYYNDVNIDRYNSTQMLIVLKITPYNYNVNTYVHLNFDIALEEFTPANLDGDAITFKHIYLNRTIYTSIDNSWDQYVGRQLSTNIAKTIINDIKDVNNDFYYTEEETEIELTNDTYPEMVEVMLTPKRDNYIIISYIPTINAKWIDSNNNQELDYQFVNVLVQNGSFTTYTMYVTGTNIIPSGDYEVVDIAGLMWQILTMPFAFVSQAFNLTLFPGTPYQLNISNLFLSIIAVFVFVWLITFFLKMKG